MSVPFLNRCCLCKDIVVPVYVNATQLKGVDGTPTTLFGGRVNPLAGSCTPIGNSYINDHNFYCGPWPKFLSESDGSAPYRPPNNYQLGIGTVSFPVCNLIGRQQYQCARWWQGVFGFLHDRGTGKLCSDGVTNATVKYLNMSVSVTVSLGISLSRVDIRNSDGVTEGDETNIITGALSSILETAVNPLSGERSASQSHSYTNNLNTVIHSYDPFVPTIETNNPILGFPTSIDSAIFSQLENFWKVWGIACSGTDISMGIGDDGDEFTGTIAAISAALVAAGSGNPNFTLSVDEFTITDGGIVLSISVNANAPYQVDDGTTTRHFTPGGSNTFDFVVSLGNANSLAAVEYDVVNLEAYYDLDDLAKFPPRIDANLTGASLTTRRERQGPFSPIFFPPETVPDYRVFSGTYADMPWIDLDCYVWIFAYADSVGAAAAKSLQLVYDGAVIGIPNPAGYGETDADHGNSGHYDYDAIQWGISGGFCAAQLSGQLTPTSDGAGGPYLSPNTTQWTPQELGYQFWPCEFFAAIQSGLVVLQRWREIQIPRPSENICRPFGDDRLEKDFTTADHCSMGGDPVKADDLPLDLRWPSCPGMVFSDLANIGGRVKVISVAGNILEVDFSQPYLSTTFTETILIYDAAMMLIGTRAATRVDGTHFDIGVALPTAAWITPQYRGSPASPGNTGTVPWVYSDCKDSSKGNWIAENYTVDLESTLATSASATLQTTPSRAPRPTFLRVAVDAPAPNTVNLGVVRQWQVSAYWKVEKICNESNNLVNRPISYITDPCYIPYYVEATDTTPEGAPWPAGTSPCDIATYPNTPWNIFKHCLAT